MAAGLVVFASSSSSPPRSLRAAESSAGSSLPYMGYSLGMAEQDTPEDAQEMVTLFSSSNHDGEQEALAIHSLLEASGIPSVVVGPSVLPSLEFRVEVER